MLINIRITFTAIITTTYRSNLVPIVKILTKRNYLRVNKINLVAIFLYYQLESIFKKKSTLLRLDFSHLETIVNFIICFFSSWKKGIYSEIEYYVVYGISKKIQEQDGERRVNLSLGLFNCQLGHRRTDLCIVGSFLRTFSKTSGWKDRFVCALK